jgi:6-phosphogluconolactonase/glucosamine-6-phosphate isomerase/deaminase
VKNDTDDRNVRLVHRHLGPILEDSAFVPMRGPSDTRSLSTFAKGYDGELAKRLGDPPQIDLIHLGLGEDGHTASLIGGDPVLAVKDRWVATTKQHNGFRRMTMTYPVLDAARLIVFLVAGRAKAEAVERVLRGDKTAPAARITNGNVLMLLDREAASRIS